MALAFRWRRTGIVFVTASILGLAVIAFSPLSLLAALTLEERFPVPDPAPERVDGIIVLGGSVNTIVSGYRGRTALTQSSERIADIAGLARSYPEAKIVFTGGSSAFFDRSTSEAGVARRYFEDFGIDPDRLVMEDKAKNTWQNAVLSKDLVQPKPGETWLLVTSAFHMPRSIGVFRKAGWPGIVAWPVDFRVGGPPDAMRFRSNAPLSLQLMDVITKEWIGLTAYYLTGRTSAFYPAP